MKRVSFHRLDNIMDIPTWVKPGIWGAIAGAVVLAIVGFSWGGWMTASAAQKSSEAQMASSVAAALTPYCVERSKSDPAAGKVLIDLKAANSYSRRDVIEKAGWATPLGTDKPNNILAGLCEAALGKTI
jgi:alpha/beta superfamily hydrolase